MTITKTTIIFCVISIGLLCVPNVSTQEDPELLKAQDTLSNSGIGVDLEESHIEDIRQHDDLPAAYNKIIESLHEEAEHCDPSEKYRRSDGVCNNLDNPLWGAVLHPQKRMLSNAYLDGSHIPRILGKSQNYLASARTVSVKCFPPNKETNKYFDKKTTQMSMQWGQYIDHDLVLTEVMPAGNCCADLKNACIHPDSFSGGPCFPIEIPEGDRYFNETCMNFKRSFSIGINGVHEQITGVTSFIDASTVYGSYQSQQDMLRAGVDGLLKTDDDNMLPNQGHFNCRKAMKPDPQEACPHAGDVRVNVFPGLTAVHLMFVREHNRLAKKLKTINPSWGDEKLFQEARRIVIALHQVITYNEYLPHVIGDDVMTFFGLKSGQYEYEPETDPSILNEFAVAAFRYGHSQINADLKTDAKKKPISEIYFQPWETQKSEGNFQRVTKHQCKSKVQKTNQFFTTEVTDKLFLDVDSPGHSTDLAARNVQRGRDHGVRSYCEYLDLSIKEMITKANIQYEQYKLPECLSDNVYESVEDLDLFVGGLHEDPLPGALVGPTFAYIIGLQFRNVKFGDRFFYETRNATVGFTEEQLDEINRMSFAHLLCRNTENSGVQPDVFHVQNAKTNKKCDCSKYTDMDLDLWKE